MIILGIHDGHNASVALVKNNQLICAVAEEKFSRIKCHEGFPFHSVDAVLKATNTSREDIDLVAFSSKESWPRYFYTKRNSSFSVDDYIREQNLYWKPLLYSGEENDYLEIFKDKINLESLPYDLSLISHQNDWEGLWNARIDHATKFLNIDESKIVVYDHHKCHAFYGFIANPNRMDKPLLVLTADGGCDGANATISVTTQNQDNLTELFRTPNCNIARMYRYTTLLLGMRPSDHEYKVMGLAAYNSEKYSEKAYNIYKNTLINDGLDFSYKEKISDHYFYFKDKLEGVRFDAIAHAVQRRTEELLTSWVQNAIDHTGISDVVFSGGVAQNIKANKRICEIPALNSLYIPPGPSDESISIGAAYLAAYENSSNKKSTKITPMGNAYIGPYLKKEETRDFVMRNMGTDLIVEDVDNVKISKLLANGEVIARFDSESMEFGPRALGYRSILADPRNSNTINTINKMIKMRDFWMPFAPTVLDYRFDDYFLNPKNIISKYMSIAFDSRDSTSQEIIAGIHPFDKTGRPQLLTYEDNPTYYKLIQEFEKITGIGVLMNTSFNIHGDPIVCSIKDAINTLRDSGLKYLYVDNMLVSKI